MDRIILSGRLIPVQIVFKKIRHTYLRIKPDKSLLITTSKRTSESSIEAFILSNEHKIIKSINQFSEPLTPLISDKIKVFGQEFAAIYNPNLKSSWIFDGQVFYYKNESKKLTALKSFYAKLVIEKSYKLLEKWHPVISKDFNVDRILIKSRFMRSQFGSCQSSKRLINMNSVLACFDMTFLETILIHELVHIKVQNHGIEFYNLLYKYVPNYTSIRKELGKLFKRIEV